MKLKPEIVLAYAEASHAMLAGLKDHQTMLEVFVRVLDVAKENSIINRQALGAELLRPRMGGGSKRADFIEIMATRVPPGFEKSDDTYANTVFEEVRQGKLFNNDRRVVCEKLGTFYIAALNARICFQSAVNG